MTLSVVRLQPLPAPPAVMLIDLMASSTSLAPSLSPFGMLLSLLPAAMRVSPSESDPLSEEQRSLVLAPMSVLGLDAFFFPFWIRFRFRSSLFWWSSRNHFGSANNIATACNVKSRPARPNRCIKVLRSLGTLHCTTVNTS